MIGGALDRLHHDVGRFAPGPRLWFEDAAQSVERHMECVQRRLRWRFRPEKLENAVAREAVSRGGKKQEKEGTRAAPRPDVVRDRPVADSEADGPSRCARSGAGGRWAACP